MGWLFALLGIGFVALALRMLRLGLNSRHWWPCQAKITNAQHVHERGPADRTQRMSQVFVAYEYEFEGQTYRSDRLRYRWNRHRLQDELAAFRPGSVHTVFVNPDNPTDAVLEPGTDATNWFALLAGLFFVGAGLLLLV